MTARRDGVLRVANFSGFYGDRLSAAREMVCGDPVEGGSIDVLTGDYLAELTMAILARDRAKDPALGYARTFPVQLREIAKTCLERDIKIVVNAGGLNPAGCADACRAVYAELDLEARIAILEGDDLLPRLGSLQAAGESFVHLDREAPLDADSLPGPILSANAYLGGWGIAKALEAGADLVIGPRIADASLVVGPCAWRFGWAKDDWDRLAGAAVAGHAIECGAQATGGNYAFFDRVQGLEHVGFPVAEIDSEGRSTITKHPGTGGAVTVGTVTAQLLYEIGAPCYVTPDVVARFDTIALSDRGPDRVGIRGVRGLPPPPTSKVAINYHGGYRNQVTFLLTGDSIAEKARMAEDSMWRRLGGRDRFEDTAVRLHRMLADPEGDDETGGYETSFSFLTIAVKDPDSRRVDRRFSAAAVELALASYPGFNLTAPPGRARPFAVFWPALIGREHIHETVTLDDVDFAIDHPPTAHRDPALEVVPAETAISASSVDDGEPTRPARLGSLCGMRSGDKGGNANLGVWTASDAAYRWLESTLTSARLRALVPEARGLRVDRHRLPNLRALNFVLHGFLGDGVAASLSIDPQAKGLGEYVRAKTIDIPVRLLDDHLNRMPVSEL